MNFAVPSVYTWVSFASLPIKQDKHRTKSVINMTKSKVSGFSFDVTNDILTALLSIEADANVLPSRYLFSPLILCRILKSNSSASCVNGESDAWKGSIISLDVIDRVNCYVIIFTIIQPQVSAYEGMWAE